MCTPTPTPKPQSAVIPNNTSAPLVTLPAKPSQPTVSPTGVEERIGQLEQRVAQTEVRQSALEQLVNNLLSFLKNIFRF